MTRSHTTAKVGRDEVVGLGTVLACLLCLSTSPALAQSADQRAVQAVVEGFLLHLGDHQFDAVADDLAPQALVVVTRLRPAAAGRGDDPQNAQWTNSYQTGAEWLAALKKNPNPVTFREPIRNVQVTVDSDRLAYVRADFQVLRDGTPLSRGVDQFTLVREPSGWKLAVIAYTSMPVLPPG